MKQRIGLVGHPSDWLVASSPDPETLRLKWGPEIVPVDLQDVIQRVQRCPGADAAQLAKALGSGAGSILEPTPHDLEMVAKVYLVLKQVVQEYELDALTLRCFDLVLDLQTTGCFALAQLNDEGIIAGCEGDLPSTLGMLWVHHVLGQIPWMANPAQIDTKNNTLVLAHCTVPRSIVRHYRLRSHFESGIGVGIQGEFETGPVTLLRIGGRELDQIWFAEGDLTSTGQDENLCRTQVEIRLAPSFSANDLLERPLGNHLVMVRGHHADKMRNWFEENQRSSLDAVN